MAESRLELSIDSRDAERSLRRLEKDLRGVDRAGDRADESVQGLGKSLGGIRSVALAASGALATLGIGRLTTDIFRTIQSTEKLQASLRTVTGSTKEASAAWKQLQEFAKTTPFALEQSVQGFIRMKSLGLDPTESAMRSFANTAAAMNTDLMQMVEAVADATTGEFERLKEYGIRASKEGERLSLTFQGVTTEIGNNAREIQQYLENIGNTNFADAAIDQMDTLGGKANNLGDSIGDLYRAIGDAGATDAFDAALNGAADTVGYLTDNVDTLAKAAGGLALVVGGRLTASLTTAAAAKLAATQQAIAYQAALARMAGVSRTAAAATGALNSALALVGGPVGAAIVAAGAIYYFRDELGLTQQQTGLTTDELADLRAELDDMNRDDLGASLDTLNTRLEQATLMAATAREELAALRAEENRGAGVLGFGAGEVGAEVRGMQAVAEAEAKLAEIKQRRSEVQRELNERDEEGVERLDDMTVTAERAAGGMRENAEATTAAAAAAAGYTDELQALRRRLQPGYAEAERFAQGLNTINIALAAGRISMGEYAELVRLLQGEMQGADDSIRDLGDTNSDTTDEMSREWERFGNSVDETFKDAFKGAFDSFEDFADQLKGAFENLLAELAYAAVKNEIRIQLGMQGSGPMSGGITGSGGLLGGGPGGISSIGGAWDAVTGGFSNIAWTGASPAINPALGMQGGVSSGALAGANSAVGGANPGLWGGSTSNFSGATGFASAGAGFAGSWAGGELFGESEYSGTLSTIGSLAGTYFGGPIGAAIGSFIGSALGGLMGYERPDPYATFSTGVPESESLWGAGSSALVDNFGATDFYGYRRGEEQDALAQFFDSVFAFDDAIAAAATPEQVEKMRAALEDYEISIRGFEGMADLVTDRVSLLGETLGNDLLSYIEALDDPAKMAQALVDTTALSNYLADIGGTALDDALSQIAADAENGQFMASVAAMASAAQTMEMLERGSERLGLQFDATASGAIYAANEINHLVGGVDQFASIQQGYYQAVSSETERLSHQQSDLAATMRGVTDTVPATVSELRSMVEAADMNTEAGRELALGLMQLAPALAETSRAVEQALTSAYQEDLGRAPDPAGLDYWMDQVASGALTLEQALSGISNSFESAIPALRNTYLEGLGRAPDADGLRYWLDQVTTGALTLEQALQSITTSAEGAEHALQEAYQRHLGREAGAAGLAYWMDQVASGALTLGQALSAIAVSQEAVDYATRAAINGVDGVTDGLDDLTDSSGRAEDALRERNRLEVELLRLQGDTAALRERELAQLDPSNHDLQQRIWALQDAKDAERELERAARERDRLQKERIRQIEEEKRAMEDAQNVLAGFVRTIDEWLAQLNATDQGMGTPQEQLNAASSDFSAQLALAQSGDRAALQSITSYADRYLDAAQRMYASGDNAETIRDDIVAALEQLPDALSAEQFLADEFRSAIETQTTTQTGSIDALPSSIESLLSSHFDAIDSNLDGMVNKSEFNSAFNGLASDSKLQSIFDELDVNGDGQISRLEAIKGSTGSTVDNTDASKGGNKTLGKLIEDLLNTTHGTIDNGYYRVAAYLGDSHNSNGISQIAAGFKAGNPFDVAVADNHSQSGSDYLGWRLAEQMAARGIGNAGTAYAKGGVFTNSVVSSPTTFPMGLMGEAGPEAIMPLTRHSDGSLGVRAEVTPIMPEFPLLGGNDVAQVMRDLKAEVAQLRRELGDSQRQIAEHTGQTRDAVAGVGRHAAQQRDIQISEQRAANRALRRQQRGQTV